MAIINPWNEIYFSVAGTPSFSYDWQVGKEYKVFVTDNRGQKEIAVAHFSIIEDVPAPTTGFSGVRAPCGWDIAILARVAANGAKSFVPYWGDGNVDDRIHRVLERDISPDGNNWDLVPGDDTVDFTEILSVNARSGTITNFDRDYEYIFWSYAPQSSVETYYSSVHYFNMGSMYQKYSNRFVDRKVLYWYWRDWWRLRGTGTTTNFDIRGGTGAHRLRKIFRRRIETDPSLGMYNTVSTVIDHGYIDNNYSRRLERNQEYIYGMVDDPGTNELVFAQIMLDDRLNPVLPSGGRYVNRAGEDSKLLVRPSDNRIIFEAGAGYILYQRDQVEEYVENVPDPDPEPDPGEEPPPTTVNCRDICVPLGDDYISEATVEVNFIDPPDWQLRRYEYIWSTPSPELNVVDTQANGRIAVVRLTHKMGENDDGVLLDYDINVVVSDLDYGLAGVSDSDDAVLTFEMPCLVINNTTGFSVNDISVPECSAGNTNTSAVFTITSDAPIEGEPRTVDYEVAGITANINTTITVLASDSNDLPFLMVRETPTTKLYLDGSFTRFWNQNAGDNGPTDIIVKLLANIPPWASDGRNTDILVIQDVSPNAYLATATGTGGFATTLDVAISQVLGAPWTYSVVNTDDVENQNQAYFENYALVIYFSTSNSQGTPAELGPNHAMIQHLPNAARSGVGLALLADHDIFYFNANKILNEIDPSLQFAGGAGVNRTGEVITVEDSVIKHGTHPLLDGLTGQFPVATSEAFIPDTTDNPDFVYTSGQVTFSEGDTTQTVNVTVLCDSVPEPDETFKLIISNPTLGTISKAEGIATIIDATPSVTEVELAEAGETFEVYIYRDISGSMQGTGLNNNGNTDSSRDSIAVQILNDFLIPSNRVVGASGASVSFFTSYVRWVLDNAPVAQTKLSILFITDAEDGYGGPAPNLVEYTSASNNHPTVASHGTFSSAQTAVSPPAQEVRAPAGTSTWANTIGALPPQIEELRITVVRLLPQERIDAANQSVIDGNPNNTAVAEEGFRSVLDSAPSEVTQASFETFSSYTTGDDSVLNERISAAVLATWNAFCTKTPETVIQVQAADEQEAIAAARPLTNCPDD